MQPFDAACRVVMLELVERRVKGTKRVTEEAVFRIGRRRGRAGTDVMRPRVVRGRHRAACGIVSSIRMRYRDSAGPQAEEQQERDTGTLNPRRTAEHHYELTDRGWTASSIGK